MPVNKNSESVDRSSRPELAADRTSLQPIATAGGEAREPFAVLDYLAAPAPRLRSLSGADLKLLRALQSILEARQADAWIDEMRTQISAELEWNET